MNTESSILQALQRGPRTAAELVAASGATQPSVSRALSRLPSVLPMRTHGSRTPVYGLIDALPDLPQEQHTVYRVVGGGTLQPIGRISAIVGSSFWYEDLENPGSSRASDSLPWFLQDLRPQGYLGRATVREFASRGWPQRLDAWTERHVLAALLLSQAHDHIGNLLIGDRAARAYLAHQANPFPALLPEDTDARVRRYTGAVRSLALSGSQSGTSVNGEQPKFVVDVEGADGPRALIVKFSGPRSTDAGRRWSDLLRMEHHALNVIRELLGIDAARTAVVADQDRTYLEVERFDRHPDGHRSGVISFSSLDAEFVGLGEGWTPVGAALVHGGHLEPSALAVIRQLELFADLIGNNDRHLGNMSAHFEGNRPMRLTPIYDFLPMRYAPTSTGEIPADPLDLAGVVARHPDVSAGDASRCQAATVEFWQRCGADTEISEQMRRLSCVHRGHPG